MNDAVSESPSGAEAGPVDIPSVQGPRVTKEQVEALAQRVQFVGGRMGDTTSTVMHAFLDGKFYLGSGHSACVSPENFNEAVGLDLAAKDVSNKVWDKLWELEGYRLYHELNPTQPA